MAHFAELDENNIVLRVVVVPNEEENRGQQYLAEDLNLGGRWEKTSYNTRKGIHYDSNTNEPSADQSKAFRKNYAGVGFIFDEERDAFYAQQPYPSWSLDEFSCIWQPPVPMPETGGPWEWNEELGEWEEIILEDFIELNPPVND